MGSTKVLLFYGIKYIYRTDSKKSNRGYENRNRTEPWKSWTVPALLACLCVLVAKGSLLCALLLIYAGHGDKKNVLKQWPSIQDF